MEMTRSLFAVGEALSNFTWRCFPSCLLFPIGWDYFCAALGTSSLPMHWSQPLAFPRLGKSRELVASAELLWLSSMIWCTSPSSFEAVELFHAPVNICNLACWVHEVKTYPWYDNFGVSHDRHATPEFWVFAVMVSWRNFQYGLIVSCKVRIKTTPGLSYDTHELMYMTKVLKSWIKLLVQFEILSTRDCISFCVYSFPFVEFKFSLLAYAYQQSPHEDNFYFFVWLKCNLVVGLDHP